MENVGYFAARTFTFPQITGPLAFDVFLRLGPNKYTKVFSKGQPVESDRLETYIQKGTQYLYLQYSDRPSFLKESLKVLNVGRQAGALGREDMQQVLDELAEHCLAEVFYRRTFDSRTELLVRSVVDTYVEIAIQNVLAFPQLLKLARTKPTLMKHMIMTAIFSTLLAKAYDSKDSRLMYLAGYTGFIHDIGLSQITIEKDEHSMSLSPLEQNELRKHPLKGAELLNVSGVPAEVRVAVMQHHEGFDGGGYPRGLSRESISLPARIVRIAEEFSALTAGDGGSFPLPPAMAAHTLARNPQIDPKLLSVFAKMLKL